MSIPATVTVNLSGRSIVCWLWVTVAALISIHVALTVVHYEVEKLPWLLRQLFDVDEEDSIPTWYSASALLLTSLLLAWWAVDRSSRADPLRYQWWGLAVGFAGLSLDEIAGLHETLNSLIDMSWAGVGLVVALAVGVAYVPFLLRLPRAIARRFVIGGMIFLGGAVGVEYFTEPYLENDQLNTLAYNLWTAVEEGMEMSGVLVFLGALFRHIRESGGVSARL